MKHDVLRQDRHDIGKPACSIESFLRDQMGMAGAEEEDPPISLGGFRHLFGNFQQPCALTFHHACLEFTHRLKVLVKSRGGECHHEILRLD